MQRMLCGVVGHRVLGAGWRSGSRAGAQLGSRQNSLSLDLVGFSFPPNACELLGPL